MFFQNKFANVYPCRNKTEKKILNYFQNQNQNEYKTLSVLSRINGLISQL